MRELKKILRIYNGFILPLLLIAVSGGIVFWGIIPGVKSIQTMFIKNDELKKEVNSVKMRVQVLESFDMNSLQSYLQTLIAAVPTEKFFPSFLTGLESVASQTQVALNSFEIIDPGSIASGSAEFAKTKTVGQYTVNADIAYAGNLDQLESFLTMIVNVKRLMAVTEFSLNFQSETDVLTSAATVRAFYMPLPKTLGKATDKIEPFSEKDLSLLSKISSYPLAQLDNLPSQPVESYREDPFRL